MITMLQHFYDRNIMFVQKRSSHRRCSVRKGVLTNFSKFTGKLLCQSLRPATLFKKRLWHSCFPVNFAKFLGTPFLQKHLWTTACRLATEMLIFRSSPSQMFFKVGALKNFAILEPLSNNKVAGLLLQNTDGGCFWIFVAANTFLQLNMVFIADSRTGFCYRSTEFNFTKKEFPARMFFL